MGSDATVPSREERAGKLVESSMKGEERRKVDGEGESRGGEGRREGRGGGMG